MRLIDMVYTYIKNVTDTHETINNYILLLIFCCHIVKHCNIVTIISSIILLFIHLECRANVLKTQYSFNGINTCSSLKCFFLSLFNTKISCQETDMKNQKYLHEHSAIFVKKKISIYISVQITTNNNSKKNHLLKWILCESIIHGKNRHGKKCKNVHTLNS